jgi:hypothetical protein
VSVVEGRVPVVTTGVTGEHRCVSWLLVVIKGEEKGLFRDSGSRVKNNSRLFVGDCFENDFL